MRRFWDDGGGRGWRSNLVDKLFCGIEIQDALAGIANDDLLAGADLVVSLGTKHDLARHALVVANFGDAAEPRNLRDALVVAEQVGVDSGAHVIALGALTRRVASRLRRCAGGLASFSFSISAVSALSSACAALTSLSRASALTINSRILSSLAAISFSANWIS